MININVYTDECTNHKVKLYLIKNAFKKKKKERSS